MKQVFLCSGRVAALARGALLVVASGCAAPAKSGEPTVAQTHEGLTSVGTAPIAGVAWQTANVGDQPGSAGYDPDQGSFTLTSQGAGPGFGGVPQLDSLQFVYVPITGDVEVVARIAEAHASSATASSIRSVIGGVMIRETTANDALMGAVWYAKAASDCRVEPAYSAGQISTFAGSGRAAYGSQHLIEPLDFAGADTDFTVPVWVRLVRVGHDFSISGRRDGGPWVPLGGGEFAPTSDTTPALVGFFAARTWAVEDNSLVASVTFDNVSVRTPALEYKTSWFDSSAVKLSTGFVSNAMHAFWVSPEGTSYKYRAEADPAEQWVDRYTSDLAPSRFYPNGEPGSTGVRLGGIAGDADNLYVTRSSGLAAPYCIEVYDRATFAPRAYSVPDGDGGTTATSCVQFGTALGKPGGLAAQGNRLYVSDWEHGLIRVVDLSASPPSEIGSFGVQTPGPLVVDHRNQLWVARLPDYPVTTDSSFNRNANATVECWNVTGTRCSSNASIALDNPTALAIDPNPGSGSVDPSTDRLLIALNGSATQNILICSNLGGTPSCNESFGTPGGVFAGATPGNLNDPTAGARFFSPAGVGVDSNHNLYVASAAPRFQIQKFAPSGSTWLGVPSRSVYGLGLETGGFDPASDGHDYYSLTRHTTLDLSQDPYASSWQPGSEWAPKSVTRNPFAPASRLPAGNPDDPRFIEGAPSTPAPELVRLSCLGPNPPAGAPTSALFMFEDWGITDGATNKVTLFEFEGEIAKPVLSIRQNRAENSLEEWAPNAAGALTLVQTLANAGNAFSGQLDCAGRLWLTFGAGPTTPVSSPTEVREFAPQFNQGAIGYDLASGIPHVLPSAAYGAFTHYNAADGALYAVYPVHSGCWPFKLERYADFRNTPASLNTPGSYSRDLPTLACGQPNSSDFPGTTSCPGDWAYRSLAVAGGKVFIGERGGPIHVHDASSGNEVTRLMAGPEVSGQQMPTDHPGVSNGLISAFQRSNGEYLITRVDTTAEARTLLFRWKERAWTPDKLGASAWYRAAPMEVMYDDTTTAVVRWHDHSGNGRDLLETVAAARPHYALTGWNGVKPTVHFDGTSLLDKNPWPQENPLGAEQPYTVLAVMKASVVQDGALAAWWGTGGLVGAWLKQDQNSLFLNSRRVGGGGGDREVTSAIDLGTRRHVVAYRYAPSAAGGQGTVTLRVDGSGADTQVDPVSFIYGGPGANQFLLGSRDGWGNVKYAGDISELIVVPRAVSDGELGLFEAYAANEWGGFDGGRPAGAACGEAPDCASGYCVDGICCLTACTSTDTCTVLHCANTPQAPGLCGSTELDDGTLCDDGNQSTSNDHCVSGVCTGGTWSPSSLSPTAWYVAAATDIVDAGGGAVSEWFDRSGHGHDVLQSNSCCRPQYVSNGWFDSQPTLRFNGINTVIDQDPWPTENPLGYEHPYTVFAVVRANDVRDAAVASWWGTGGTVGAWLHQSGTNLFMQSRRYGGEGGDTWSTDTLNLGTNRHVLAYRYANGTFRLAVDGLAHEQTETVGTVTQMVGGQYVNMFLIGWGDAWGGRKFNGDISELVLAPDAISDADVTSFYQYAQGKWGGL